MRHSLSLLTVVVALGAVCMFGVNTGFAGEPAWYDAPCNGSIGCGHWNSGVTLNDCAAAGGGKGAKGLGDITVAPGPGPNDVTVTVENLQVSWQVKHARVRIEGTGDTPTLATVTGRNDIPPNSVVTAIAPTDIGGTPGVDWYVEIDVSIEPQPDWVDVTLTFPAKAVGTVVDVWAWDCCRMVPAVSSWGLLVMVLLGLTAGAIIFKRRQRVAA